MHISDFIVPIGLDCPPWRVCDFGWLAMTSVRREKIRKKGFVIVSKPGIILGFNEK
jgi:hypothetical protein